MITITIEESTMSQNNTNSTSAAVNSQGYRILSGVEDLLGRLNVASERKISRNTNPFLELLPLGFPSPYDATNKQLGQLQPFYVELLLNIEADKKRDDTFILSRLDSSDDEAMLLLYVLEFPFMVLSARNNFIGVSEAHRGCDVREAFTNPDIVERITSNKRLISWCRNEGIGNHHSHSLSVIASAVSLLKSVQTLADIPGMLSKSKAIKLIRNCIFDGENDEKGFEYLRNDLADIVTRDDLNGDFGGTILAESIMLQWSVLSSLYQKDRVVQILLNAENKEIFGTALSKFENRIYPNVYKRLRVIIFGSEDPITGTFSDMTLQNEQDNREACNLVFVCDCEGCTKAGTLRCTRCKLVGYCSKECQIVSWKKHKENCNVKGKKGPSNEQILAATAAARIAINPALIRQDKLLVQEPDATYVIKLPGVRRNFVIRPLHVDDSFGRVQMKLLRKIAPTSPRAVHEIYDQLSQSISPDYHVPLRQQLIAEYDIDPLSDDAMRPPKPIFNDKDIDKELLLFDKRLRARIVRHVIDNGYGHKVKNNIPLRKRFKSLR